MAFRRESNDGVCVALVSLCAINENRIVERSLSLISFNSGNWKWKLSFEDLFSKIVTRNCLAHSSVRCSLSATEKKKKVASLNYVGASFPSNVSINLTVNIYRLASKYGKGIRSKQKKKVGGMKM